MMMTRLFASMIQRTDTFVFTPLENIHSQCGCTLLPPFFSFFLSFLSTGVPSTPVKRFCSLILKRTFEWNFFTGYKSFFLRILFLRSCFLKNVRGLLEEGKISLRIREKI